MPYIEQATRDQIDPELDALARTLEQYGVGELNYAISVLCDRFAVRNGSFRYEDSVNDVVGTLECVKLEFYHQAAENYEALKKLLNGPVHTRSDAAIQVAWKAARQRHG